MTLSAAAEQELLKLVQGGLRRVVHLGCGGGRLGKSLKEQFEGRQVRGIEADPLRAQEARALLDDVHASPDPGALPPAHWPRPDCVFLEELPAGEAEARDLLRTWASRLESGGAVVFGLPRAGHTRTSLLALAEAAGCTVERIQRVLDPPRGGGLFRILDRWARRAAAEEPAQGYPGRWGRRLLDRWTSAWAVRVGLPVDLRQPSPAEPPEAPLPAAGRRDPEEGEGAFPLVSIVIASYNYGRFLDQAIRSALGQRGVRVEVLVVDDGSADDSLAVARRHPVTLLEQARQGVCRARNLGASHAKGDFLMFLDADDVLDPDYAARCLEALRGAEAGVGYAYTHMRYIGRESGVFQSRPFDRKALLKGNYIHASALMRRAAFDAVGGYDVRWGLGHEDHELWVRMLAHGITGVLVPEPLLSYRRHGSSRNTLTRRERAELAWKMRLSHPSLYWRKILKHPLKALRWKLRFRG